MNIEIEKQNFFINKVTELQQTNSLIYKKLEKIYNDEFLRSYIEKNIDKNFFENLKDFLV
jgi:hypothetical protein